MGTMYIREKIMNKTSINKCVSRTSAWNIFIYDFVKERSFNFFCLQKSLIPATVSILSGLLASFTKYQTEFLAKKCLIFRLGSLLTALVSWKRKMLTKTKSYEAASLHLNRSCGICPSNRVALRI